MHKSFFPLLFWEWKTLRILNLNTKASHPDLLHRNDGEGSKIKTTYTVTSDDIKAVKIHDLSPRSDKIFNEFIP